MDLAQYNRPHTRLAAGSVDKTVAEMVRLARIFSKDVAVRRLAEAIVAGVMPRDRVSEAAALCDWVASHVRYVRDPVGVELLRTPEALLRDGQGDCDDLAVLLCSLEGSLGFAVRFVVGEEPVSGQGHIWAEVHIPSFDAWVATDPVSGRHASEMLKRLIIRRVVPAFGGSMASLNGCRTCGELGDYDSDVNALETYMTASAAAIESAFTKDEIATIVSKLSSLGGNSPAMAYFGKRLVELSKGSTGKSLVIAQAFVEAQQLAASKPTGKIGILATGEVVKSSTTKDLPADMLAALNKRLKSPGAKQESFSDGSNSSECIGCKDTETTPGLKGSSYSSSSSKSTTSSSSGIPWWGKALLAAGAGGGLLLLAKRRK